MIKTSIEPSATPPFRAESQQTLSPGAIMSELVCSPLEYVELIDLPRVVSDKYNPPPMGSDARHQGVDFCYYNWKGHGMLEGTQVKSAFSGKVAASEKDTFPYGNIIIIETLSAALPDDVRVVFGIESDESLYLLYGHLAEGSPLFSLGDQVSRCDAIGKVGHSGNADASHLHLEMRVGLSGRIFEGFSAFRDSDTARAKQNYQIWRSSGEFLHFDPLRLLLFEYTAVRPQLQPMKECHKKALKGCQKRKPAL